MNKKATVMAMALMAALGVMAAPHHGGRHHGGPRGGRPMMAYHHGGHYGHHHHHHGGVWGRGGRNFWPGLVGGVMGGMIYEATRPSPVVVTTPTVVTTPVVTTPVVTTPVVTTPVVTTPVMTTQNVWVEGRYVDQVQPNGVVIRVWQPGHYEQRTVYVQ